MTITSFCAKTTGAFQNNGNVTEMIIAVTTVTNLSKLARVSDVFHHLIVYFTYTMVLFERRLI